MEKKKPPRLIGGFSENLNFKLFQLGTGFKLVFQDIWYFHWNWIRQIYTKPFSPGRAKLLYFYRKNTILLSFTFASKLAAHV
jgi:hypothetical protein